MYYSTIKVKSISRNLIVVAIAFVLVGTGCSDKNAVSTALFFPVDSLLNRQIHKLTESDASLRKTAFMGGSESTAEYTPRDTSAWKRELEIFHHIDMINKPVNQGLYMIDERVDEISGLRVKSFITREDLPVQSLKVFFAENPVQISHLEAQVREKNLMYSGTRFLQMQFGTFGDNSFIKTFSVKGGHKMFLADSVEYTIRASIQIPD